MALLNIWVAITSSVPFICYRLVVHINRVENLPPKGEHYTYSVVVKLIILPSDKPVRVSRIYKNDLNPEIEEDFEFAVKHPLGKVLRFSLYDADHQGKYDAIGHALFYLEDVLAGHSRKYAMKLYKQSQVSNCSLMAISTNMDSSMCTNHIPQ
jgi:Ca2+-dependent lipid-binding protein